MISGPKSLLFPYTLLAQAHVLRAARSQHTMKSRMPPPGIVLVATDTRRVVHQLPFADSHKIIDPDGDRIRHTVILPVIDHKLQEIQAHRIGSKTGAV